MDPKFWLQRWQENHIGWHKPAYNELLVQHWPKFEVKPGAKVFVPMCGKTLDMKWLVSEKHPVVGIELSHIALEAFFDEAKLEWQEDQLGELALLKANDYALYCGDYFELTADDLVGVGGVYDRGSLVAMPPKVRQRYADHVLRILPEGASIMLVTLEYDQHLVAGPPHCVLPEEVEALYGERCVISVVESKTTEQVPPHFQAQGVNRAVEAVYKIVKER